MKKIRLTLIGLTISIPVFAYQIFTPTPTDNQVEMKAPSGYIKCYEIKTGLYKSIWNGRHQVCRYAMANPEIWIAGYWQCSRYTPSKGICHAWTWVAPQWSSIKEVQLEPDDVYIRSGRHLVW